jgi:large subunit ribosomal protein L24
MVLRSSKARVQRKKMHNAPAHVKSKAVAAHLSADLRQKYGIRTVRVCRGDTVVVMKGNEDVRGNEGKIMEVITNTGCVIIDGVTVKQADGTAVSRPVHASNLVVTKLDLKDEWRSDLITKAKEAKQ